MVGHVFFHPQIQVVSVLIILTCRNVFVFLFRFLQYCPVAFFIPPDLFGVRGQPLPTGRSGSGSFPVPGHAFPCSRPGQLHYLCCPSDSGGHAQDTPGVVHHSYKGFLMIVNQDSLVIFDRGAFYSFVPFFLRAKYIAFPSGAAHTNT